MWSNRYRRKLSSSGPSSFLNADHCSNDFRPYRAQNNVVTWYYREQSPVWLLNEKLISYILGLYQKKLESEVNRGQCHQCSWRTTFRIGIEYMKWDLVRCCSNTKSILQGSNNSATINAGRTSGAIVIWGRFYPQSALNFFPRWTRRFPRRPQQDCCEHHWNRKRPTFRHMWPPSG